VAVEEVEVVVVVEVAFGVNKVKHRSDGQEIYITLEFINNDEIII
jgi:hypothetical protein